MAVHLPEYPSNLSENPAYHGVVDDYRNRTRSWYKYELEQRFGQILVRQLLKHKDFFVENKRHETVVPSFLVLSSNANLVLREVSEQKRYFTELQELLPVAMQSVTRFKNILVFLWNFNQIQVFTPPSSTLTYIALEGYAEVEEEIDEIYYCADDLEQRFRYQIPVFAPDPAANIRI